MTVRNSTATPASPSLVASAQMPNLLLQRIRIYWLGAGVCWKPSISNYEQTAVVGRDNWAVELGRKLSHAPPHEQQTCCNDENNKSPWQCICEVHILEAYDADESSVYGSHHYRCNQGHCCRPAGRREIPRLRSNRLRLPSGGANQLPGRELHRCIP